MRRLTRALVLVACAAGLGAAPAAVPAQQTFKVAALKVSVELPAGWRRDRPDSEWKWRWIAPGSIAHLYVDGTPTTRDFSVLSREYVAALRKPFTPGNPHLGFASWSLQVASVPAVGISYRFRNLGLEGAPYQVATIYAFLHGGRFYVFEYMASPKWIAKMRPTFEQSIRSVRFI